MLSISRSDDRAQERSKNMKNKGHSTIAMLSLLSLPTLEARPIPAFNLTDLANAADIIVIGEINSTAQIGLTTIDLDAKNVHIPRRLQGRRCRS
jgi:hypothetical protein